MQNANPEPLDDGIGQHDQDSPDVPLKEDEHRAPTKNATGAANTERPAKPERPRSTRAEVVIALLTFAILVTYIGLYLLSSDQLKLTREALESSDRRSATILNEMKNQGKAMQDSANAATVQAAISKSALEASIETSRRDQRAWLGVRGMVLSKEPEGSEPIRITAILANTGKTPAMLINNKSQKWIGAGGNPPWKTWDQVATSEGAETIFPGDTTRSLTLSFGVFRPDMFRPDMFDTGANEINLYRDRRATMHVQVRLEYVDVFGCRPWTPICLYRDFGEPLNTFHPCAQGNDIDREISQCTQ